jgi:tetratricopeptide (TPR) repeat protein
MNLRRLRQILNEHFNEGELRTLCFDLGVDYDNLPGGGKADKARELVAYLQRHSRLSELIEIGEQQRTDIPWKDAFKVSPRTVLSRAREIKGLRLIVGVVALGLIVLGAIRAFQITEISTLNERGCEAHRKGQYREALNYYQQALVIHREVGNRAGEGSMLTNIGVVYYSQGQYDQALEYYQQALVIHREVGNRAREGSTLTNIGVAHYSQGQYDQALEYHQQALVIRREVGDRAGEGVTLNHIGSPGKTVYKFA